MQKNVFYATTTSNKQLIFQ